MCDGLATGSHDQSWLMHSEGNGNTSKGCLCSNPEGQISLFSDSDVLSFDPSEQDGDSPLESYDCAVGATRPGT